VLKRVKDPMRTWVDQLEAKLKLSVNQDGKREALVALKIAGFSSDNPPSAKPALVIKIVKAIWFKKEENPHRTSGGKISTAAVVSGNSNCPRCGGPMADVVISDGVPGRYCLNPRCRVAAYVE